MARCARVLDIYYSVVGNLFFALCRVKHYEAKLAALGAINSALQKENGDMCKELQRARSNNPASDAEEELAELHEEFTRRLGQADKTIAQLQVWPAASGSLQERSI